MMNARSTACSARIHEVPFSSWISRFLYDPSREGGLLAVYTHEGEVLIHSGVPAWKVGLLKAGIWRKDPKTGRRVRSSGSAYAKLIRGAGHPFQRVGIEQFH